MSEQSKDIATQKPRFDGPWKQILDLYFKNFMELCWPDKYSLIDWKKGVRMLDKELLKIDKEAAMGDGSVDKLIEIHCLSGELTYLILHLEVQRSAQSHFAKRMFQYRYRLLDLHDKPIASLALLIDANPSWRPTSYLQEVWGSSVEMKFPIIKLLDYQDRARELEQSSNPFAHVILAQLAVNKKQDPEARLETKFELTRNLYRLVCSIYLLELDRL
ncbi:MAG: hypothetical protein KA508_06800 [Gammaproteobacteria bacterium]|nr:hypothetical protein [Gammaproteobacteria bacterium]